MFDGSRVDAMCEAARRVARHQAELLQAMLAVADEAIGIGFDCDEVAFALHLQRQHAQREVALARDLIGRLPAVFAALSAGKICLARARVFADTLAAVQDDTLARSIADEVLPRAPQWTATQIRYRLLKALLAADPDAAAQRLARSVEQRRLSLSANDDTTACLSGIYLPPAKAAAAFERVDAIARGLKNDGEARTLDQLRADVFVDLLAGISPAAGPLLRAGAVELLVLLATLTGQSDAPGMLAGYGPVLADIARQIAAPSVTSSVGHADDGGVAATPAAAGGVIAPAAPMQWRFRVVDDDGTLLFHGTTRARPQPAATKSPPQDVAATQTNQPQGEQVEPQEPGRRQAPAAQQRAAHRDRRQPGPPEQDNPTARFPTTRLRGWIAARDTTCRAPGCTTPARSCDVDHTIDHAHGGLTTHDNLGLACRHHHRLKHEGGFRLEQPHPGHFRWISPTGHVYDVPPDPP